MPLSEDYFLVSLLDNDFYKFTMQQAVIKLFPKAKAKYKFINRGNHSFPPDFAHALQSAVNAMANLKLTNDEKNYLAITCPYFDPTYLDFLQGYKYNPSEVFIEQSEDRVEVSVEGLWYRTILWEVPLLSLISELFYKLNEGGRITDEEITRCTENKIEKFKTLGVTVAEFGTRRRYSYKVHRLVIDALKRSGGKNFIGTSNVHLAMKNAVKPIGTHAHEWFMFHAAKYGYKLANLLALENWVKIYRGDLGIALSDTYTTAIFFEQFDKMFSKLFDGVRHDSGDPVTFGEKTINHYVSKGIDPLSKTIIFSDSLNYEKVARISQYCKGKIGMSFGIGTNLTNDVGPKPMNIVIKMTEAFPEEAHWIPVVKLSDEKGKYTGQAEAIKLAKTILEIE
ncbi:nicotinate phosphoribosyltransferase [Rubrolithibacter danxiaensis]|uniref:nicotinate phosphoribosyltransferase n=1 Tax=Rubrolithibacter danxiaensis TaxID=3390805 RepID=UPI003BF8AD11